MKTITNIVRCNLKKEKSRSILLIISIFLTTMLLALIITFGYGAAKANRVNAGALYGKYYGTYERVSEESLRQMKLRADFTDIGILGRPGTGKAGDFELELVYVDESAMNMTNMADMVTDGAYPESGNEIAAQPSFFKVLGMEQPEIGKEIAVKYRTGQDAPFQEETFVISGILYEQNNGIKNNSFTACVSAEYYENKIPEEKREYTVFVNLDKAAGLNLDNAEDYMKELAVLCGIPAEYAEANSLYLMWILEPGYEVIFGCSLVCLVVVFISAMVIYNIFQVGVVRKVQEYGRLKAVGTTKRQMRSIIFREGMTLAAVGVPTGTLAGYIEGELVVRHFLQMRNNLNMIAPLNIVSSFSFPLLLGAAALGFVTVWAALRKPMKIAASISPVEAMRFQGRKKGGGQRRGYRSMNIWKMTLANLSSNRKRTVTTILTMGLSCVFFVVVSNLGGNMDPVYDARLNLPYGQFEIHLDYSMEDTVYPENNLDSILSDNPLSETMIRKIQEIDGVTGVSTGKILYAAEMTGESAGQERLMSILVLNREDFKRQSAGGGGIGEPDYDRTAAEDGIIFGWSNFMVSNGYVTGQKLPMTIWDGVEERVWEPPIMGAFSTLEGTLAMTEDTCRAMGLTGNITRCIWVDCRESDRQRVRTALEELTARTEHVELTAFEDVLKISKMGIGLLQLCAYTLSLLIGVISFMNMANTIITSIESRKREFGILQAVGMTKGQLNRSLQLEGLIITVGSAAVSLVVGLPLGYSAFTWARNNAIVGISIYRFPVVEIVSMTALLALMQITLSYVLSRNLKKESPVERIRYQE